MNQNQVRLGLTKYRLEPLQHANRDFIQRLAVLHHVQIIVRNDLEYFQHLIQQLAVLRGYAYDGFNMFWVPVQLKNQGRHFDRLRAHSEYRHHFNFGHCP
ncbi:hypothetical protein D3C73_1407860 [compost metagenome]